MVAAVIKNPVGKRRQFQGLFERMIVCTALIDPASVADGVGQTIQITGVTGAALGDYVLVAAPYDLVDFTVTAYVQAAGVVEIRLQNESAAGPNIAEGTWNVLVLGTRNFG